MYIIENAVRSVMQDGELVNEECYVVNLVTGVQKVRAWPCDLDSLQEATNAIKLLLGKHV